MSILARRRVRLKIDAAARTSDKIKDVKTGQTPELWKGNDVQFEIGIFFGATLLTDVSNIASLTLLVRQTNASGAVLMSKTVTAADIHAITQNAWDGESDQHAAVAFTGTEANIAAGTHWLVVSVTTTDSPGRDITLGATSFLVAEDGSGAETAAQVLDGLAYPRDVADARFIQRAGDQNWFRQSGGNLYLYNSGTGLWYPLVLEIRDGVPTVVPGPGETL